MINHAMNTIDGPDRPVHALFPQHAAARMAGRCPLCQKFINVNEFRAEIDLREFHISGLCQECQDKMFGV